MRRQPDKDLVSSVHQCNIHCLAAMCSISQAHNKYLLVDEQIINGKITE
jgi:hypothetical protein